MTCAEREQRTPKKRTTQKQWATTSTDQTKGHAHTQREREKKKRDSSILLCSCSCLTFPECGTTVAPLPRWRAAAAASRAIFRNALRWSWRHRHVAVTSNPASLLVSATIFQGRRRTLLIPLRGAAAAFFWGDTKRSLQFGDERKEGRGNERREEGGQKKGKRGIRAELIRPLKGI